MIHNLIIENDSFILHPTGAVFWEKESKLLISDIHLGKVSHFRKFGMAIPRKVIYKNFQLLQETLDYFKPKQVIFLGDLFHSSLNLEWVFFEDFVNESETNFVLVMGNHDIISRDKYRKIGVQIYDKLIFDKFLFTHYPQEEDNYFNFAGHIHPAIRLKGKGRQSLKLPCFFKKKNQMILPAFGEFTGSHVLKKTPKVDLYAIADEMVIKI